MVFLAYQVCVVSGLILIMIFPCCASDEHSFATLNSINNATEGNRLPCLPLGSCLKTYATVPISRH